MSEQEQKNTSGGKALEGQGGGAGGARGTALVMMEQTSPKPYRTLRDDTASAPELQRPNYKRARGMPVHSVAEEIKHALDETIPENQATDNKWKHSDRENTREHKKMSPKSKKRDSSDEITLAPIENMAPQTLNKQPIPENIKSLSAAASSNSGSAASKHDETDNDAPDTRNPEVARKQSEWDQVETDSAKNVEENSVDANRTPYSSETTLKLSKGQYATGSSLMLEKRTSLDCTSSYIKPSGTTLSLSKGRYETDPALIVEEQNSGDACDEGTASYVHPTALSQNEGHDENPEQLTLPVIQSENVTKYDGEEVHANIIEPGMSLSSTKEFKNDGIINEGTNRKEKPRGISMSISKKSLRKNKCKNSSTQSGGSRRGSKLSKNESESENDVDSDDEGKSEGSSKKNILSIIRNKMAVLGSKLRDSLDF